MSVSEKKPGLVSADRRLFTTKLYVQYKIFENCHLGISGESYFDIDERLLDYSFGLYLSWKGDFTLLHL